MAWYNNHEQKQQSPLKLSYLQDRNKYNCSVIKSLGQGAFKQAYLVQVADTAIKDANAPKIKKGVKAAIKVQRNRKIKDRSGWNKDLDELEQLGKYCQRWNQIADKPIIVSKPYVLKVRDSYKSGVLSLSKGEYVLIEPEIKDFEKFNHPFASVSAMKGAGGKNKDELHTLSIQAFCHFSYYISKGQELVCDCQGYRGQYYHLTDPYFLSDKQDIKDWFNTHFCNRFCSMSWPVPRGCVRKQLNINYEAAQVYKNQNKTGIPCTNMKWT